MNSITNSQKQNIPILGQVVAQDLILIDNESYNIADALEVAVAIIECFSRETLSPDTLRLVMYQVLKRRPANITKVDYEHLVASIFARADAIRQGNILSGMF